MVFIAGLNTVQSGQNRQTGFWNTVLRDRCYGISAKIHEGKNAAFDFD
jgi:hypothetical protein